MGPEGKAEHLGEHVLREDVEGAFESQCTVLGVRGIHRQVPESSFNSIGSLTLVEAWRSTSSA